MAGTPPTPKELMQEVLNLTTLVQQLQQQNVQVLTQLTEMRQEIVLSKPTPTTSGSNGGETPNSIHGLCSDVENCSKCREVLDTIYAHGERDVLAIPGVQEAVDYHQQATAMGLRDANWHSIPGVAESVAFHKILLTPVQMVH